MSRFHFILVAGVTLFLYFEIPIQVWFLRLIGGYLIKIWVPPLLLFWYVLIKKLAQKRGLMKINLINLSLAFYSIFGFFSMIFNESSYYLAIKYYLIMIAPVWLYVVIIECFKDNRDIKKMIYILLFCIFLLSLYTFYLQYVYLISPSEIPEEITTSAGNAIGFAGEAFYSEQESIQYSRGLMVYEHGVYCGLLAPFVFFSILFYFISRNKMKYIYLIISFFMIYQILNTMSRSGIISFFSGLFVLLCIAYYREVRVRGTVILFSLLLGSIVFYIFISKPYIIRRLLQPINILGFGFINEYLMAYEILDLSGIGGIDQHIVTLFISLDVFIRNPFLGSGFTFAAVEINELNRYLFILVSAGLLTVIPYIIFFTGLTFSIGKYLRYLNLMNSKDSYMEYLFFALSITYLVKLMNQGLELYYYWIFFSLSSAWIRNWRRELLSLQRLRVGPGNYIPMNGSME
jgi:hypothetical protein